jgi:hypothetical protein
MPPPDLKIDGGVLRGCPNPKSAKSPNITLLPVLLARADEVIS